MLSSCLKFRSLFFKSGTLIIVYKDPVKQLSKDWPDILQAAVSVEGSLQCLDGRKHVCSSLNWPTGWADPSLQLYH